MNSHISHANSSLELRNSTTSHHQGPSNIGRTETIVFLAIILLTFGFVCFSNPPFRRRRRHALQQQQQSHETQSCRTNVDDKKARMEFVEANLPYRIVESSDDDDLDDDDEDDDEDDNSIDMCKQSFQAPSAPALRMDHVGTENNESRTIVSGTSNEFTSSSLVSCKRCTRSNVCSICLSSYHKGNEVSWSTNPSCHHEYHRYCIQNWLTSHEECPMCRNVFLLYETTTTTTTTITKTLPPQSDSVVVLFETIPPEVTLHHHQQQSHVEAQTSITIHIGP